MTANDLTVLDLLDALLRIDSVNPGLDPGGAGEADIAAFIADWGRVTDMKVRTASCVRRRSTSTPWPCPTTRSGTVPSSCWPRTCTISRNATGRMC
jgi:hypothetical protein